jgi:hypothetical protein
MPGLGALPPDPRPSLGDERLVVIPSPGQAMPYAGTSGAC